MKQKKKQCKLGIMGGTFDPIHIGHLLIAEASCEEYDLDKVVFIPTGHPPHKAKEYVGEAYHRLNMVKLAIEDNPHFEWSDMEINREGRTYTIDTLKQLKLMFPDNEIYFIIGGDTLLEIHTWKQWQNVLKLCNFIVYNRPGYDDSSVRQQVVKLTHLGASIFIVDGCTMGISSTTIRARIKQKRSIKYMVPSSIEKYILDHGLYIDKQEE
ncbi:MAG: nicotinate-nucleotide adenylyltransferase [Xylanivirga thermophila]|uniref:nicotinate-nucleotide adenylyltransferase n=1 Tax=Xylanivirga thermophila TaxID=2496273 RepID=UPI00101E10F2|nr:nicotinate-nucleotide adenylyltransferase [Xylanivirga thermophila]